MERILNQNFSINYQYAIFFTEALFSRENPKFKDFLKQRQHPEFQQKILFVVDSEVDRNHPQLQQDILNYFQDIAQVVSTPYFLVVPGGEICKNDPKALADIVHAIDRFGIDRHSYVVGIGGGAILDLVGYAAAISHRGIRHIRIPTTVLSQNDSGVGVKNSVNYQGKKNFLGTFTPPIAVFNDFDFLKTLDHRSWLAGISEAIKVALIKDLAFFEWIAKNRHQLPVRQCEEMKDLIYRCADLHLEHIRNGDPFELGSSRPLDFGHWSAHKMEQLSDFKILHGEAVAIGLAIDVLYSSYIGNISEEEALQVVQVIHDLGLPVYHSILDPEENRNLILQGLVEFQEHLGGRLTIVLLKEMGKGMDYHALDHSLIRKALDRLKHFELQNQHLHEVS